LSIATSVSTDKRPSNPQLYNIALKGRDEQYSNDSYLITTVSSYTAPEVAATGFLFTFHTGYPVLYSAHSSELTVTMYQTALHQIPQDFSLPQQRCENIKSLQAVLHVQIKYSFIECL
jgi:hypothetical protein